VNAPAIAVNKLSKYYGDYAALREVSFQVERGSCMALLGRNGAGKTTLLRVMSGLLTPSEGKVQVLGADVRQSATRERIGVLNHGIGLYDELSAEENLRLFARMYTISEASARAAHWLEKVGLTRVRESLVREFSRGMRQRLAVARVFLHDPEVLLLDEPFTALDDKAIALLQSLLRDALSEGKTVIMSTHQLREALELATHVALITRGRLTRTAQRTPEMLHDPGYIYREWE
jgi:heme ABC exporter ATP-binding subunit CcmA